MENWFYSAQRLFKNWRNEHDLAGTCAKQTVTKHILEEDWFVYPVQGGKQEYVKLFAYKGTGEVYIIKENSGDRISLREIQLPQNNQPN